MKLKIEDLKRHYPADEAAAIFDLMSVADSLPKEEQHRFRLEGLRALFPHELLFMQKTFWILQKKGAPCLLVPNYAQRRFYEDVVVRCQNEGRPTRGIILKARQLGFSTFIKGLQYTRCLLQDHRNSLTVSYDTTSTQELFAKARFAHQRHICTLPTDFMAREKIQFAEPNGSTFLAITAGNQNLGRSFTFHDVHCSEIPMWKDTQTTLNGLGESVPETIDSSVFWESTARGMTNVFYDAWVDAEAGENNMVPFFCPWFWDPKYSLDFQTQAHRSTFRRSLNAEDRRYQDRYGLTDEQMNWRASKLASPQMTRPLFKQEYPADAKEAFLSAGTPAFKTEKILDMLDRTSAPKRVCDIVLTR